MKHGENERTGNVRPRPQTGAHRAKVVCLGCVRAAREGRPWGCLVHVAEGVL